MNPSQREGPNWPNSLNLNRNSEQPAARPSGQANQLSNPASNQQQNQSSGPVLPPPAFYSTSGPGGPSLPNISGIAQSSPGLHRSSIPNHEQSNSPPNHQPSHAPYSLPSISQGPASQSLNSISNYERERDIHEARDREAREYDQARQRERDAQEREMIDRQQREQQGPHHQNHAEHTPLHQPVAIGPPMRSAINGLKPFMASGPPPGSNANSGSQNASQGGPIGLSGSSYDALGRGNTQQSSQTSQQPNPFGNTPTMQQMQGSGPGHGQQPILNDALSYLDQVKVQFSGEPNVYNQFLDIMKDFKSQAIDTPGVIRRVSTLFAGNPVLIQGFNTFLPPGYRIECGTSDDPNAIRVTTPMGTTVSPMGSTLRPSSNPRMHNTNGTLSGQTIYDSGTKGTDGNWHTVANDQFDSLISPSQRAQGIRQSRLSPFEGHSHRDEAPANNLALLAHQQEQRGVSQLQNAVSAATGESIRQTAPVASPMADPSASASGASLNLGPQQGGSGIEKGGRVEFNHAISYVNKIKNRFSDQPEIYKQFLEILQTYQRESKPIQDVYAQVTHLFNGAPDLLEAFKQFLPESAAHAKAQAARQAAEDMTQLSSVRGDASYVDRSAHLSQHTPRAEHRLPPVGNFAPTPSAGRDVKRKRADRQNFVSNSNTTPDFSSSLKGNAGPNKRSKTNQQPTSSNKLQMQQELPAVSPTLIPALPEPMPPSTTTGATSDELAFFERVKKFIASKNTMNEFLKLCNLYSQDLMDKNSLVFRAQSFIGHNPDLFEYFKNFVDYDGKDQIIENKARSLSGRLSLNNCRAYGPSYRLLPRRERLKVCSGRDELCNSVLNDEWASHPTWASEDSGFIAHKKNIHEEGLHRIEEERHDYDINIAVAERVIQILEPLAHTLKTASEEAKQRMDLNHDVAGQSRAIFKKVATKIYGRDTGVQVVNQLFDHPATVVPVLLIRTRASCEAWKASQREWDKVWRDQTQKMYWKSLDHQGITAKMADKRQFQTKTLQNEIQIKYEEQKRQRLNPNGSSINHQAEWSFHDSEVLYHAAHLFLVYAENSHPTEFARLTSFMKEFIPVFFGIDVNDFQQRIDNVFDPNTSADEEMEDEPQANEALPATRGRKQNGRKSDLLRDVLERGRYGRSNRQDKDQSASASRATSEDRGSAIEEEADSSEDETKLRSWLDQPIEAGNKIGKHDLKPNEVYKRSTFNLYANTTIYCFFRMFAILFERLSSLKANEPDVHEAIKRGKATKSALDLHMLDKHPEDFFNDTSDTANYYHQVLGMLEGLLKADGSMEMSHIEEVLRRYYLQTGWMLYSFDKMLSATVRFAIAMLSGDAKDKSFELLSLFLKDRKKPETTHQEELLYRKHVEKYVKDGDIYRISIYEPKRFATIRILKKDDTTFDANNREDGLYTPGHRWWYYISSFTAMEATENVQQSLVFNPLLERDMTFVKRQYGPGEDGGGRSSKNKIEEIASSMNETHKRLAQIRSKEALRVRVSPTNYRIIWAHENSSNGSRLNGSDEWWYASDKSDDLLAGEDEARLPEDSPKDTNTAEVTGTENMDEDNPMHSKNESDHADKESHQDGDDNLGNFEEKFTMNSSWMAGASRDDVARHNSAFTDLKGTEGNVTSEKKDATTTTEDVDMKD